MKFCRVNLLSVAEFTKFKVKPAKSNCASGVIVFSLFVYLTQCLKIYVLFFQLLAFVLKVVRNFCNVLNI